MLGLKLLKWIVLHLNDLKGPGRGAYWVLFLMCFHCHNKSKARSGFPVTLICTVSLSCFVFSLIVLCVKKKKKKVYCTGTAIYQISAATLCSQGIHMLAAQQLLQTIDKICMNVPASIVVGSKGTQSDFIIIIIT